MKYHVVSAFNLTTLLETVNSFIRSGWKPLGGISVVQSTNPDKLQLFQSVVLENDNQGER